MINEAEHIRLAESLIAKADYSVDLGATPVATQIQLAIAHALVVIATRPIKA